MGSDQHVDAHVELLMADEEGVVDVPLDDVGLGLIGGVRPFGDLSDVAEEEDALALAAADLDIGRGTGFMIHTTFCSLYFLNYSRKMGYSLGML